MVYEILSKLIRKHFYIVYSERFQNEVAQRYLERFVAKHPLLRPKLIVVNDQVHGFKKVSTKVASLEKFPIYLELEYSEDDKDTRFVESIDMYAEAGIKCMNKLSDVIYLANTYSKTIFLDRVKRVNDPSQESLLIYSRISELFKEEYLENDLSEGLITASELEMMFEVSLISFVNFIKILDDILVKGKKLNRIDEIFNVPEV